MIPYTSKHSHVSPRGFTLLIAVVLASVALSLGLALLDIALKQVILASTSKQSHIAFYAADTVLECALYLDQKLGSFNYTTPRNLSTSGDTCNGLGFTGYTVTVGTPTTTTKANVQCTSGVLGSFEVHKNGTTGKTNIYATGYNDCSVTSARRIERGLKASY